MPGQIRDPETGFHYNYHRYYDPRTGRYLTPDPIGQLGGINLFLYANNNSTNEIDPLGLLGAAIVQGGIGGPIGISQPQNKQLQEAYKLVANDITDYAKGSVIDSLSFYSFVVATVSPLQRGKITDYESEKRKLKTRNTQIEIKYGGLCREKQSPEDECEKMRNYRWYNPQFRTLPVWRRALLRAIEFIVCAGNDPNDTLMSGGAM